MKQRLTVVLIVIATGLGAAVAPAQRWFPLGAGPDDDAEAMAVIPTGPRAGVYVGGDLLSAGGVPGTAGVARWSGNQWHAVGGGLQGSVHALGSYEGILLATGNPLRDSAGVLLNLPAAWSGGTWAPLGGGTNGSVNAFLDYNPSGAPGANVLVVGGSFSFAGGVAASHVASWTPGGGWAPIGTNAPPFVTNLAAWDQGTGTELYAEASGVISRWNGNTWSFEAPGLQGPVCAMVAFGGDLYAAGTFAFAGTVPVSNVARWDGSVWSAVGGLGPVGDLLVWDDGTGPALWACEDDGPGSRVWRLDPVTDTWSPVGDPFSEDIEELCVLDGVLYTGGDFLFNGGRITPFVAGLFDRSRGTRIGSLLDLDLSTGVNGLADPLVDVKSVTAGDSLATTLISHDGTYTGEIPILRGDLFATAAGPPAPICPPGLGCLHLDAGSIITLFDGTSAPFFGLFQLPASGLHLTWPIPSGFAGQSLMIQGLVLAPDPTTPYVATNAHEIVLF